MRNFIAIICFSILAVAVHGQGSFFKASDAFLKSHVNESGQVDYAKIKAAPAKLDALVADIASFSNSGKDKYTQKAFYINAYNLLMIKYIIDNYPVASPLDITGVFDQKKYKVAGQSLSLSDIENKVLRVQFPDARLHFVLVCGAIGCPKIGNFAYQPLLLESQLTQRTKLAMEDKGFIRVIEASAQVKISKIFEWYADDFRKTGKSNLEYINSFRGSKIPSNYSVSFYDYDWSLNEKKK